VQSSSQNVTTNKPTPSFLTGRMPFLSPNQQCQSTEGKNMQILPSQSLLRMAFTFSKNCFIFTDLNLKKKQFLTDFTQSNALTNESSWPVMYYNNLHRNAGNGRRWQWEIAHDKFDHLSYNVTARLAAVHLTRQCTGQLPHHHTCTLTPPPRRVLPHRTHMHITSVKVSDWSILR